MQWTIEVICGTRNHPDFLDAWKHSGMEINGNSLAAELQRVIREKLKVRAPHNPIEYKFQESFVLQKIDEFHNGLEKLIGYPSLNDDVVAVMKREPERGECFFDSQKRRIDPKVEWNIVVRSGKWRIDGIGCEPVHTIGKRKIGLNYQHFMTLAEQLFPAAVLNEAEVIALRLWTGPMHRKYADIVRNQDGDSFPRGPITTLTAYSNTLHAINSGITKLARVWKIPRSRKVYRGYSKVELHQLPKDEYGCRGGVERAFLATTEDFDVAVNYSSAGAFILEINVGLVNKGADIGWLSQFPHEKEILFNALSSVEFLGNPQVHFVKAKGRIQVYKVEISSNTKSKTLEQCVHLRKDLHMNMTDVLVNQALLVVDQRRQDAKDDLVNNLCFKCQAYSDVIVQKGKNADEAVFNEGRDEYVDLVRDVITYQKQSLSIIDLALQWFREKKARPLDLMNLAEWQLQALRSAFKESCEPPEIKTLILEQRQQQFPQSVFCAEHINLGGISTYDAALATCRLVRLNPTLQSLTLEANWATADFWMKLFYEFVQHSSIDFCFNGIALSRYASRSLKRLEFRNQEAQHASMLVAALVHYPPIALTQINLCSCPIGCSGAEILGQAFSSLQDLASLGLSECLVSDRGCTGLAKSLVMLSALESLDLSRNKIGDKGALSIAPVLSMLCSLKVLDLSHNIVGDDGATALTNGLNVTDMAVLEIMDLRFNETTVKPSQFGPVSKLKNNVIAELLCKESVHCVAWSPNGAKLASGSEDGTIIIWDARTGKQKFQLRCHHFIVTSVVWSPDGSKLASGSRDGTIIIWDTLTGEQKAQLNGHINAVNSVVWSSDGSRIASGGGDMFGNNPHLIVWNAIDKTMLSELKGHTQTVNSVVWSPEGFMIASGSDDKTIILWDEQTEKQKNQLKGHSGPVISVAWSLMGSMIASGSNDKTIIIWDATSGEQKIQLIGHKYHVRSVAWSLQGSIIASASFKDIIFWDVETGEQTTQLRGHTAWVNTVAWSPDGSVIASGSQDQTVMIWDMEIGKDETRLKGHSGSVHSVTWCPKGSMVVSGGGKYGVGEVFIWDAKTGEQKTQVKGHSNMVLSVAWNPGGSLIACESSNNTITIWDAETGEQKTQLEGHSGVVYSIAWNPKGSLIISGGGGDQNPARESQILPLRGGGSSAPQCKISSLASLFQVESCSLPVERICAYEEGQKEDRFSSPPISTTAKVYEKHGKITVWDAETGQQLDKFIGHSGPVLSVAWSHDGDMIASGSRDGTIIIWDAKTGLQRNQLVGHHKPVNSVAWSPKFDRFTTLGTIRFSLLKSIFTLGCDGFVIASASDDKTIKIWDAETGEQKAELKGHTKPVCSVAWSPKELLIASGSHDNTVIIWDAKTGQQNAQLKGHTGFVLSVTWSPGGTMIASGSNDKTILIWDAQSGQRKTQIRDRPERFAIASKSHDQLLIASDAPTRQEKIQLRVHTRYVRSVAWNPEGSKIASGAGDYYSAKAGEIIIWDATNGTKLSELKGHTRVVTSVVWSPEGSKLASGSRDDTIIIWDAQTGKQISRLSGHTDTVHSVAWSPDGSKLASGLNDGTIIIWDAGTGMQKNKLKSHTNIVRSVAWSPEGSKLASGSSDSTVIIWDAQTGEQKSQLKGHSDTVCSVAWSPEGSMIASGSVDNMIIIWNVMTGKKVSRLKGHRDHVKSVTWSTEGDQLASASNDKTVIVWDVMSGQMISMLEGHTSSVLSVAWCPRRNQIASGSSDLSVIIWDLASHQQVSRPNRQPGPDKNARVCLGKHVGEVEVFHGAYERKVGAGGRTQVGRSHRGRAGYC